MWHDSPPHRGQENNAKGLTASNQWVVVVSWGHGPCALLVNDEANVVMYNTSFSQYRYAVEAKKTTFRIALLEIKLPRYITFTLNVLCSSFHSCNSRPKASKYLSLSLRRYPVLGQDLSFFLVFLSFVLSSQVPFFQGFNSDHSDAMSVC